MIDIEMQEEIQYKELHAEYRKLYTNNKGLLDSMHYAAFVQQAFYPRKGILKDYLKITLLFINRKVLLAETYTG